MYADGRMSTADEWIHLLLCSGVVSIRYCWSIVALWDVFTRPIASFTTCNKSSKTTFV